MNMNKRAFLKAGSAGLAALSVSTAAFASSTKMAESKHSTLKNITQSVSAITTKEREIRIKKAQKLMQQMNISALIIEPGAAMDYFSGIQWWRSERLTALVIPQQGKVGIVCPFFEEPSIQESLAITGDIRVWQEHESPFERIKQILVDRNISLAKGTIGFENSVRYFVQHGVMSLLSNMQHVSAEPVTRGCRIIKSHHELQLMHKANEVTLLAYSEVYSKLEVGMTSSHVKSLMSNAQSMLGGNSPWNMALIDQASAFPHGSKKKHLIQEGSIVLMDCGCNVHGYQSDISRTFVVGEPSKRQRDIWQTVRTGQKIAFEQAQIGSAAGLVDDAVRKHYQAQGFGPDYKLPGLSHRTGHGIGMEGHESVNFVHGEQEKLRAGMCFSNEPGIYIPGEFGVRLEDCIYMTDKGPQWFTVPPDSLDSPLGKVATFT
ncbi:MULTISPECIES: M24 family metallopeptidase [unclassified Colwellia]|uniref:M24 family metallopeptidase n=1 Tax=unclassified Colwellia TaxID=196834 RepID=UPI0015F4016E|nr:MULTISPECIES: Xaa-Pro peptidase family protein [unclassified Colwellia]MBA6254947.1 aminopeptidase P family protein [Colwellia sp. MB3u-28]MBA6259102.1 aminopeptidase P family protein [Colwellia sp. MB3u-41]MBA6302090.1 aminopeptidase P family protein [Colwellia sp. MB02u-14]